MKEDQGSQPAPVAQEVTQETRRVRTITHGDTTYDVYVGPCKECGTHSIFRVLRSCGASFSVYQIAEDDFENIDDYVSKLHESFTVDVATKLFVLRRTVNDLNARGYFEGVGLHPFRVRMVDKARLLLSRFHKAGLIEHILNHADEADDDIAGAFVLGCLATENHWFEAHNDAVIEGYAVIEGREAGRPLALAARRRQGRRTRAAVIAAANELYQQDPSLRRNDSKLAERMAAKRLPKLQKRDGTFLGSDAIVKHLRAARRQKRL
jgi:hypothetical protein